MTAAIANRKSQIANPAMRHEVYFRLIGLMPWANCEQVERFRANLGIREHDDRLLNLRVTPDIAETRPHQPSTVDIERYMNVKCGERLAGVAGFYRRGEGQPFRLNWPRASALYFYGGRMSGCGVPVFYDGVLVQPLDRRDTFYLLSASKYGGPRAARLPVADQMFFTQFEEGK